MAAKKKRKGIVLPLLVVAIIVYLIFNLIQSEVTISTKRQQLAAVQNQLDAQKALNEEITRELAGSDDEIVERAARDNLGYAKPSERIFIDRTGK